MGGHPLHPALVHFPIAFFIGAVVLTYLYIRTQNKSYDSAAFYALAGTVLGAVASVLSGIIDFGNVPVPKSNLLANTAIYNAANIHMWLGLVFLIPAFAAFWLRYRDENILDSSNRNLYLGLLAAGLILVSIAGYTGWEANPYVQPLK